MKTTRNITLDINRADVINVYDVHQGEACSREFALTLTDGSSIVDLSNNVTAKANATVNHVIVAIDEPLTIVNNKIILLLTENMQSLSGILKVDVTVLEGDEILTAATLRFRVSPAAIDGNSRFEPLYPTLQDMINAGIKPEAITAAVNAYLDEHGAENLVYEALDLAFTGDPYIAPTLLVDNTIDATYNPNGHYILYYIDSDGGRHNLFDLSQNFAEKSTTYTKSEVDALVSGGVVPQYVIDESESVLAKAFSHTGLGRTVRFIAVSDGHNDAAEVSHSYTRIANKHCGQAVKYIAERIPLDFVASLGDMTWAGVAHTTAQYQTDWLKADLQEMNLFLRDGFGGVPNIRVVGNHDQCATTGSGGAVSRLQNSGAYQLIGRYNAGTGDGLSNYGYYDIERAKLRVIYLNTSDTVSTSTQGTLLSVSQAQKNWLCETLIALNEKSDAAGWKILLMSHAPLDMNSGIAADILLPYTNGGTYGSYTFANHSAKIIGNCHGHTHCYNVGYMSDKIRRFTIPNANFYDNNHYKNNASYAAWNEDTTYPKTENSRTDTSFSLVTVDLDSLTCYVDNYGAGYDREFSLDYKSEPAPVNLFDKTDADVVIGGRFNSSRAVVADQQEALVTGYIPATAADVLHVVTNKANDSTSYVGAAQLYDSGKNYIGIYISPKASQSAGISPKPTWAADYLSGDFDLSVAPNSGTNTGVAYIRFCLAYTDIDEIVIT